MTKQYIQDVESGNIYSMDDQNHIYREGAE
jgi:hypothetical protein